MKKLTSVFLAIVIASCFLGCGNAEGINPIEPTFTRAIGKTPKEWMASSEDRALFSFCLWMDYFISTEDSERYEIDLLSSTSYVGRNGMLVILLTSIEGGSKAIMLGYDMGNDVAAWGIFDAGSDGALKAAIKGACENEYYKNDIADMYTVHKAMLEVLNSK